MRALVPSLFTLTALVTSSAAQSQLVFTEYQFNNPKIRSVELDGTNLQELFTIPSSEWLPVGPVVDASAGRVYWADSAGASNVLGANLDGSALSSLVSIPGSAKGVQLDGAGRLYYTAGNSIRRALTDGSGEQTLFTALQTFPLSAPCVDATNGHVYFWADEEILRMDLDGANVRTVVTGVSSVRAIELDVSQSLIYWIDADTISDFVGRARLDNTGFMVLVDNSPSVVQSSGLIDVLLEPGGAQLYYANDIDDTIRRAGLDGSGDALFYASPAGLSPSGLALSTGRPAQALADCNGNGVADDTDIQLGTSSDCNLNGFPDECEVGDPCVAPTFLLDHGSDPAPASRAVGGASAAPGAQWEVFQPFDVPAGGWDVARIGFDGWTANWADGSGFTATLFPDDGSGTFADESAPISSAAYNLRFNPDTVTWVDEPWALSLAPARYWLRLTSNDPGVYNGAINVAAAGMGTLGSISRSGLGNLFPAAPIALRITEETCAVPTVYCTAKLTSGGCTPSIASSGVPSASGAFTLSCAQVEPGVVGIVFYSTTGAAATPFQGGFLCLQPPVTRVLPAQSSGGAAPCSGAYGHDVSALLGSGGLVVGASAWFQYWFRDPPAPFGSGFSDALAFTICP